MPDVIARALERRQTQVIVQRHVKGPLSGEQRDLLLKGADSCPVDNTLTTPVEIETTIEVVPQ